MLLTQNWLHLEMRVRNHSPINIFWKLVQGRQKMANCNWAGRISTLLSHSVTGCFDIPGPVCLLLKRHCWWLLKIETEGWGSTTKLYLAWQILSNHMVPIAIIDRSIPIGNNFCILFFSAWCSIRFDSSRFSILQAACHKTKLFCNTPRRRTTTDCLETYPPSRKTEKVWVCFNALSWTLFKSHQLVKSFLKLTSTSQWLV